MIPRGGDDELIGECWQWVRSPDSLYKYGNDLDIG